ncbi:MAG: nitronate monooxygenase [Bacteroidota bacterium]
METLPLIEGGKGISISNGESSGAWAAAGGIGTFSAVNADSYDDKGNLIQQVYKGKTRSERHKELIEFAIKGGITQAKIAYERACNRGRIHMNVLWEMGGCEKIVEGILDKTKGLVHGVTCGAGMPYKIAEIAAKHSIEYLPIVSSARAFRALWLRSYRKFSDFLGGVVYEDPWLAGGHNGLSNSENPEQPQKPYERVVELRKYMKSVGLDYVPIIMAGGVWWLSEWTEWLDNDEIGPIAFQFGTRPLITQESPISKNWMQRLLTLKKGDVFLNRFSPTGFYSSAVRNEFLNQLIARSQRQVSYARTPIDNLTNEVSVGSRGRKIYVSNKDQSRIQEWVSQGFTEALRTPDQTIVFEKPDTAEKIHQDQVDCMGCLSQCKFSNWAQNAKGTTGHRADPRSFCIQKSLMDISHNDSHDSLDKNLMFAGHNAYKFLQDPFYKDGFIPTVKQLIERIKTGA